VFIVGEELQQITSAMPKHMRPVKLEAIKQEPGLEYEIAQITDPSAAPVSHVFARDVDLSPYERARLANIARNRALLQQLGLADSLSNGPAAAAPVKAALAQAFSPDTVRKPKREPRTSVEVEGLRRSSRLLSLGSGDGASADAPHPTIFTGFSDMARDAGLAAAAGGPDGEDNDILLPEHLDDFEFEVYTMLREWRLSVCRPLQLEPYKVFQNRTLVEAVRRRRDDEAWGSTQQQLLECWGIGPVKVRVALPPHPCPAVTPVQVQQGIFGHTKGYAWQLIEQMQLPAAASLLHSSRVKQAHDGSEVAAASTPAESSPSPPPPPEPAGSRRQQQPQPVPSPTASHRRAHQPEESSCSKRPRAEAATAAQAPPLAVRVTRSRCLALQC
jgi:hypothetical protein